jgi:hypothetical protein
MLVLQENKKQWDEQDGTAIAEAYIFDNEKDPYQFDKIPFETRPAIAKDILNELAIKLRKANDPRYQKKKYDNIIPYSELK